MNNLKNKNILLCVTGSIAAYKACDLLRNLRKEEANVQVRSTRKAAYGDIGDQLDEIYKDIDAWKARIKSVKDNNPKQ